LIAIAQDFPEDAVVIHHEVGQLQDLAPVVTSGVLRLTIGYEILYSSRITSTGDVRVLLGRIQQIIH